MILFQKLKYKNFLSSGNYWTEIDFTSNSSTLIIGQNGAGKSTMLDALTFVLFNKPFRKINKGQLVNTVNEKDCSVELTFKIGSTNYKIVRGIKPNIFEVYKNNEIFDQLAASTDQQKWLEQSLLKLNYKSFTQIVILGSSSFIPFMQLSLQHRREVVEDILDIRVFSTMNETAKVYIKELKDELKQLLYKKDLSEDKIQNQKDFIEKLEKNEKDSIKQKENKINDLLKLNENIVSNNQQLDIQIKTLNDQIDEFSSASDKLKKLVSLKGKIQQKVITITEDHKFFTDNTVCPTCKQNIEEEFRLNKINDAQLSAKELQKGYQELETAIQDEEKRELEFNKLSKEIISLNHEISKNNFSNIQYQKQINELQLEIQNITDSTQERDIENTKLKQLNQEFKNIINDIAIKKEELSNYEFIVSLLKDDGAKSKIIKKYLPIINHNLNKYLDLLDFSINFTLDEEFNEKALNPIYDDFSYASFSEGEKMRIDLALLFTWREIAKVKNSTNTNLLILDEVFDSSLDDFGTDNFTKIIRYVIKDSNVFVISHKTEELEDKFENVLKFQKQKGFSVLLDT
jgi:DNA repair exonuclease SbcCD ATPase subunit